MMDFPVLTHSIADLRKILAPPRASGKTIGFVPTMGALHEGHASLIRRAAAENDHVIVSIYVNPTQFGPGEDFTIYPRTLDADLKIVKAAGGHDVFTAADKDMYPEGYSTWVEVGALAHQLCGASRPAHFRGVATVVAKLLNIVAPTRAYFGRKDYQQSVIIRRMARDLNMPVEIVVCSTARESDGLALSSRNRFLSAIERERALCLSRALRLARRRFVEGERNASRLAAALRHFLSATPEVRLEYAALVDPETLLAVAELRADTVLALAARVGTTRLIDNASLGEEDDPAADG